MSMDNLSSASLEYFQKNNIQSLLDEALRDVLQEMPEDPLAYLEEALARPTPLRLMVAGPPGSGKSTQCAKLAAEYNICHICPEDSMETGKTDEDIGSQVVALVRQAEAAQAGWVLEGFPATRAQAIYLQSARVSPQRLLFLDAPDDVCASRCLAQPGAPNATELKLRLEAFAARKEEVLECYGSFVVRIDADRPVDEVYAEIAAQCSAIPRAK